MTNEITYAQISGSICYLLQLWAAIEKQVRIEVSSAYSGNPPKSAYGIAGVLNAWEQGVIMGASPGTLRVMLASALRAQIQEPLNVRNGLCHGLCGLSASLRDEPASFTWEINEERRSITWDELQADFRWLARVPSAISMISNSSSEKLGNRISDSPENREWWLGEFGIELPPPTQQ
jgi:hypothetical protein